MKFFLVKNSNFRLHYDRVNGIAKFSEPVSSRVIRPVTLEKFNETNKLCNDFRQRLYSRSSRGFEYMYGEIGPATNAENGPVFLKLRSGPVTNVLMQMFGCDVTIQVVISNMYCSGYGTVGSFQTTEMEIQHDQDYACKDPDFFKGNQGYGFRYSYLVDRDISGELAITATVNQPCAPQAMIEAPVVTDKMQFNRKMLLEELGCDMVFISGDGKMIKAHKCMLLAHSLVFNAMFQSGMQEAISHTIHLPDMTEAGVRGVLAYLYCWETSEPNSKPVVAFEMLQAGHKYDIPMLEAAMKKMLLAKPTSWFDVEIAMKLFLLARNLPAVDGDCLKMKAAKVLKMNFGNFKSSPTYISLFREDPYTAMDVCEFLSGI